jgi:archaetidylinositol phosphate synthase
MLDGRWKHLQDPFWDPLGRVLARRGITANQVTITGTLLMGLHCAGYLFHHSSLWFGVGIALIELSDDVDGAIARVTGTSSAFGAYLDAVTDRYKEIAVYAALGLVTGAWPLVFACITGAMLTSYNKARAGMEKPVSNVAWPDMFERLERIVVLCVGLIASPLLSPHLLLGQSLLTVSLALIAVGTHATALQRFARARSLLR